MGRISILLASLMVVVLTVSSTATAFDYKGALEMSLLFFEAQRSGKLPPDHRVKWRSDSALTDGFKQGVDLVGGYCDAGDHVKFVFPMAFAVTMLSWGVIEFEKEMIAASQLKQALGAIRWGTDYFLKAHKAPNTLWVQLFSFADTFRGRYNDTLKFALKFYPSSTGFHDELLWAATWLYEATNDQTYLNYVSQNALAFGGTG